MIYGGLFSTIGMAIIGLIAWAIMEYHIRSRRKKFYNDAGNNRGSS